MEFIGRVFYDAYLKFVNDDGWAIASHIALSFLTSMFPFLIFVTALAGFFGAKESADAAAKLLLETWPPEVAGPMANEIHNVLTQTRSGLLTMGAVLAIYFSASGIEALRIGLNRAYDVKDLRPWWLLRLESILFALVGAFSLLAFTFILVFAPLAWAWTQHLAPALAEQLAHLYTLVRFGVSTLVLLIVLVVCHKYLAAGRRSLKEIGPGVALTLSAWLIFGAAFGAYLAQFAVNYVSTYAGLASVMIALVFLYTLGAIFVFGGELNAALVRERRKSRRAVAI
jgi:membrane protein